MAQKLNDERRLRQPEVLQPVQPLKAQPLQKGIGQATLWVKDPQLVDEDRAGGLTRDADLLAGDIEIGPGASQGGSGVRQELAAVPSAGGAGLARAG